MSNSDDHRSDDVGRNHQPERREPLTDDVDGILDEIDEILEENAEEFVRSYVRRGGQGWSGFFTPEFYVGAAAAGILAGASYDIFKTVIHSITKALLQVPGRSTVTPEEYEAAVKAGYETLVIKEAWNTASRLARKKDIQHSIDEATALHWALFTIELERSLGYIHLGARRYEQLARVSAYDHELSGPSELVMRIVDQWLEQNTLHGRLRKAREDAGLTQENVAQRLQWSLSKVIRIESGLVGVPTKDLTALLRLYKVDNPQLVSQLIAQGKASRGRGKRSRRPHT